MKIFRWLMNWISGVIAIVALASIILGVLLVNDIAQFREQFYEKGSVLYLDIDHRIESGFEVDPTGADEAEFSPVPLADMYDLTEYYIYEDYPKMLRGTSKVFIFQEEAFDDYEHARVGDQNSDDVILLKKDDVIKLLKSHELLDQFEPTTGLTPEEVFGAGLNADDIRWRLFARLVFTQVEDEGPIFLLHGMRNGYISAHPESITFQLFPLIPEQVLDWLAAPDRVRRMKEGQ